MRKITGSLTKELKDFLGEQDVRRADAYEVKSYRDLMQHVAKLSFENKDHLLFFRGQATEYLNKAGASSFYPSIYRGERTTKVELEARFDILAAASKRLAEAFVSQKIEGASELKRRKYMQWSILQHYEVCPTPLLDFSQSVRVACSFALLNNDQPHAYIFVFGLPYVTNRISVNSEHDLVNVRLLSICPPDALRPYYQEGYLAGTDESTIDFHSKEEFDFNSRLIAKFIIPNKASFWGKGFSAIPEIALYPKGDKIERLCKDLGKELGTEANPGQIGLFLQAWVGLESMLLSLARTRSDKIFSVLEALRVLQTKEVIDGAILKRIDHARRFRNTLVHTPDKIQSAEISLMRQTIDELTKDIKSVAS